MTSIISALTQVLQAPGYRWLSLCCFTTSLLLYLFILPSSYTGGIPGLVALQYLDLTMIVLSFIMALLLALIVSIVVWLMRQGQNSSKASATSGAILGILTPLLCYSPIIPILFAVIATVLPAFISLPGSVFQGFIVTHQMALFILAIFLMLWALYQNSLRVVEGNCCQLK